MSNTRKTNKPILIVVVGPTASGKSDLAVDIARAVDGEVISADSRQVYRGMDLGTGKITKKEMRGIPHHLLDVASPKRTYSVAHFKRDAEKAIQDITRRGKVPILCGGTGQYIEAVVDGITPPEVKPDPALRKKLEKRTTTELHAELLALDPDRASVIDSHNPRRLIRAIEVAHALGSVPKIQKKSSYTTLQIGIRTVDEGLKKLIHERLLRRMREGMVAEANRLHESGVTWRRMDELGLEYRYLALLLQKTISRDEFLEVLTNKIWQYSKRQRTWLKRDKRIVWFDREDRQNAIPLVQEFISKNTKK